MLLRVFSLLLIFTIGLFASLPGTNFGIFGDALPVYVVGDASGVADAFNFVGMITGNKFTQGILLAGTIFALYRTAMKTGQGDAKGAGLEFIFIFVVIFFFLAPSTTVAVKDGRVDNGAIVDPVAAAEYGYVTYQRVDNIPLGIAAIASFTTTVSWDLANILEIAINPVFDGSTPSPGGVTTAGLNQPAKDLKWIMSNLTRPSDTNGSNYSALLSQYVIVCALPTVDVNMANAVKIMNPPGGDYKTYLSPSELPVAGTSIINPINKAQTDCSTYWNTNLSGAAASAFETNVIDQFKEYKKYSGTTPADEASYHTLIRKMINAQSTTAIATLKDATGALKRASVINAAVASASTGISGIDNTNRMAMTEAKQGLMIQGPASFAWLGEVLPLALNIAIGFLVVMSIIMAIFLLFQGWVKGLGVILNFASGFFALTFSYVTLAITQGIVNRSAFKNAIEQYHSQGSPLQIRNYDFLLEQSATMDGLTGLLGALFVSAGAAIVFYGESKMIVGGIMGKVQGSFGGNNLDKASEDNAKDTALSESMEALNKDKMSKKLTEAGIPFDGGNIEYEYAKLQKSISELGAAHGSRAAMSEENSHSNTFAGAAVQSYDKSMNQQGYGSKALEIAGGDLDSVESIDSAFEKLKAGSVTKGRGSADAAFGEAEVLSDPIKAAHFEEGMRRDAMVKTSKTVGVGAAVPTDGDGNTMSMNEYLENAEKESAVGFVSAGLKAEAVADYAATDEGDGKIGINTDYAKGLYREAGSGVMATRMKGVVVDGNENEISNEDYIKNSAAMAFKKEVEGQAAGAEIRKNLGEDFAGLTTQYPNDIPNEKNQKRDGKKTGTSQKEDQEEEKSTQNKNVAPPKDLTPEEMVENITGTKGLKTPLQKDVAKMLSGLKGDQNPMAAIKDLLSGIAPNEETQKMLASLGKMTTVGKIASVASKIGESIDLEEVGEKEFDPSRPESVFNQKEKKVGPLNKSAKNTDVDDDKKQSTSESKKPSLSEGEYEEVKGMIKDGKMTDGEWDRFNEISDKKGGVLEPVRNSINYPGMEGVKSPMQELNKLQKKSSPKNTAVDSGQGSTREANDAPGEASQSEINAASNLGLPVSEYRKLKRSIAGHESSGSEEKRANAENRFGFIGKYQFGAGALVDAGLVDREKYMRATHKNAKLGRVFNKGMSQKSFLANPDNWTSKAPNGKQSFMGNQEMQSDAMDVLLQKNGKTLKRLGVNMGDDSRTKGLLMAAHIGGAGNAVKFAKHGIGFRDGNGTSIAKYYHAGANDISNGYAGGQKYSRTNNGKGSYGGGNKNSHTGSMGIGAVAGAHAAKGLDEWIGSGHSVAENISSTPGMYRTNAYYAEATRAQSTQGSIVAQGGVQSAIATSVAMATDSASRQQAMFSGQMVQTGMAAGMSAPDAKKFSEEMISGGAKVAEMFKNGIIAAGRSAATVSGAEKEGQTQVKTAKLKEEFGENLTGSSTITGKSYTQEKEAKADDAKSAKKESWEKRQESLKKQAEFIDSINDPKSGKSTAAAMIVDSSLTNSIMQEKSYSEQGRQTALAKKDALVSDIQEGKEVSAERIEKDFGEKVGSRMIEDMKLNDVAFKDEEWSIGSNDTIDTPTTGKRAQTQAVAQILTPEVNAQREMNAQALQSSDPDISISQEEFDKRESAAQYLLMGLRGENGGSVPIEKFKDAGFSQETISELGITEAPTEAADGRNRMFQISHIDSSNVLDAKSSRLKVKSNESFVDELPTQEASSENPVSNSNDKKDTPTSWLELTAAHEGKKVDEFIGGGKGIINNITNSGDDDLYARNALYGEQSKAMSTAAKLDAQGGVDQAVGIDTAESTVKASMQKGGTEEQVKQLLMSEGKSESEADQLIKAMSEGGAIASQLIASGIVGAASGLAGAQSGAKTRSDLKNIEQSGGKEDFVYAAGVEGAKKGAVSKIQNIDLLDQEKSQNYVDDIDKHLSAQSPEKRAENLGIMKEVGLVTQDSEVGNLKATSGETFALAQAKLAAGAMDRSERFAIGDTSVNAVRDVTTGHARLETREGNVRTYGNEVNNNHGYNIRNPIQAALNVADVDTTNAGKDGSGAEDDVAATAVAGIAGAGVIAGGGALANKMTGGAVTKGYTAVKHKIKGHTQGKDKNGKGGVYYSNEKWEELEKEGMAQKKNDGWELKVDREKARDFTNTQPSSAGNVHNNQADKTTNATAAPIKNADNMKSPLLDNDNYSTNSEIAQKRDEIKSMDAKEAGKSSLNNALDESKKMYDQGSVQHTLIDQMKNSVNEGRPVDGELFKEVTGVDAPTYKEGVINVGRVGNNEKNKALNALDKQEVNIKHPELEASKSVDGDKKEEIGKAEQSKISDDFQSRHGLGDTSATPDASPSNVSDVSAEGNKAPKGKLATFAALLMGTSAAATAGSVIPSAPVSKSEDTAFGGPTAMDVGFNALNAAGGALEISNGASSSLSTLKSPSAYIDGGKEVLGDFVDTKSIKAIGTEFAEDGVMAGGKALGKAGLKKLPFVGVAAGATFAYGRAKEGDYMGAAMEFASGAVSMIPGVGTMASVAIDGALMKRDYDANNEVQGISHETPNLENNVTPVSDNKPNLSAGASSSIENRQDNKPSEKNPSSVPNNNNGNTSPEQERKNTSATVPTPSSTDTMANESVQQNNTDNLNVASVNDTRIEDTTSNPQNNALPIEDIRSGTKTRTAGNSQDNASGRGKSDMAQGQDANFYSENESHSSLDSSSDNNTNSENYSPSVIDNKSLVPNPTNARKAQEKIRNIAAKTNNMNDMEAGEAYIETIAPVDSREELVRESRAGTLTSTKMIEKGVSPEVAKDIPSNEEGFIDTSAAGQMYKSGLSGMVGVMDAQMQPSIQYGTGIIDPANSGMSFAAANALEMNNAQGMISQQVSQPTHVNQAQNEAPMTIAPANNDSVQSSTVTLSEAAKVATSPGNIQTSSSDINQSVGEVAHAVNNAMAQAMSQVSAEDMAFNTQSIADLAGGFSLDAPIKTQGGELTLGQQNGYVTLGGGESPYVTQIPYEALQSAPSTMKEELAGTLSNTKLNNEAVQNYVENDDAALAKAGDTNQMLYEINEEGKKGSLNTRIQSDDQVSLLEDLVMSMEKMEMATSPKMKKVI